MNTLVPAYQRPNAPRPYTQAQAGLIKSLMGERNITPEQLVAVFPERPTTFSDASAVINWLKDQPVKAVEAPTTPQVRDGSYALRNEDGEVKFYKVNTGTRGKWKGFVFVSAQASDEEFPIRNRQAKVDILAAIAKDEKAALALYGQELGRCGRCGRTLTSEYRKLGIGPICIDK
jgi:hypothetical protein